MSSFVYSTVRVRLGRLSPLLLARLWGVRAEQSQAFNLGVELGLAGVEDGGRVPSCFEAFKELTVRRATGAMPSEVPVVLQRGGLGAGFDAVAKWYKAAVRNDRLSVTGRTG